MLTTLVVLTSRHPHEDPATVVDQILRATTSEVEVLVVDEGPLSGPAVLDDAVLAEQRLHVLRRPDAGRGSGAACLAGFAWALQHEYDLVVEMAADGSHLPGHLPRLLDAVQDVDVVVGSRWIPGARVERSTRMRRLLSRSGNRLVGRALGTEVHDITGGYRVFHADVLRAIRLDTVRTTEPCFRIDLLRRAVATGCSVAELPVIVIEQQQGRSRTRPRAALETVAQVARWGVEQRRGQRFRGGTDPSTVGPAL